MQYAQCNRCHGPLDPGYRYCKTCGLDQSNPFAHVQAPAFQQQNALSDDQQSIRFLMLILVIRYGVMLLNSMIFYGLQWLHIGYGMISLFSKLLLFGYMIALIIFAVKIKHRLARILIWSVFGIEVFYFVKGLFSYTPFFDF